MKNPIKLEILSLNPITYKQCQQCESFFDQSGIGQQVRKEITSEYPAEIVQDRYRLSDIVVDLIRKYQNKINIQVIDPQSPLGLIKSFRYWVRSYPAFIIDGKEVVTGFNNTALEHALRTRLDRTS